MKRFIAILSLTFMAACAATSRFAPTAEEMPALQSKVPGLTYEDANQGYKIYISHCSNCHRLHNPNEYTATKWAKVLPEMLGKAKIADTTQQLLVRNYLAAKSK